MRTLPYRCAAIAAILLLVPLSTSGVPVVPDRLALDLSLFDGIGLSPAAQATMISEVATIFEDIGVDVNWLDRVANPSITGSAPVEIKIILSVSNPAAWSLKEKTLGVVLVPHWDTVYIFPRSIARTLGLRDKDDGRPLIGRDLEIAQALGRVIVHEVVHAIAPAHIHAEAGIMRGRQSRRTLIEEQARLDGRCADAFRQGFGALSP